MMSQRKLFLRLLRILLSAAAVNFVLLALVIGMGLSLPPDVPARYLSDAIDYVVPKVFVAFREQFCDGPAVLGYADRHSLNPGEEFQVMLSTREQNLSVSGQLEIYRLGGATEGHRQLMFRSGQLQVSYSESLGTVSATGCHWPVAATVAVPPTWKSGYYSMDFVLANSDRIQEVAYIVVLNPAKDGDIVVLLSTNTYQAYNQWGGFSLYSGQLGSRDASVMVSFDRPTLSHFQSWEFYYVSWLEGLGYKVDYITNFDLYRDSDWAERPLLFIVLGHNEYWSSQEYDALEKRIFALGKNTMFLGGNICYWQIRYLDLNQPPGLKPWGRQLVCHKWRRDPITDRVGENGARLLTTDQFRSGHRRPESMLMGVMYESDFRDDLPWFALWKRKRVPRYRVFLGSKVYEGFRGAYKPYFPEYHVVNNQFSFFEGTGLMVGESVGGLIGYEWDNRDPESTRATGNWKEGISLNQRIPPEDIKVVLAGKAVDMGGQTLLAEAVYFRSPRGAKVFSAGTIRWPWGLSKPGFVNEKFKRLNLNLIREFAERSTPPGSRKL